MWENTRCVQCTVGSIIFLQILLGLVFFLTIFGTRSDNYSFHKNQIAMTYWSLISAALLFTSSCLLLFGVILRQPKYLLAHLWVDVVIVSLVLTFIAVANYNNGGYPEVAVSMGFALGLPVGLMCGFDLGVYYFYHKMVAGARHQQENRYELCNTDGN